MYQCHTVLIRWLYRLFYNWARPSSLPFLSNVFLTILTWVCFSTWFFFFNINFSAIVVTNLPASAGDVIGTSLFSGWGRYPGGVNGSPLQFLVWRIPWTEEPCRLQSIGLQRVRHDWVTYHTCTSIKKVYSCFCWVCVKFFINSGNWQFMMLNPKKLGLSFICLSLFS